MIPAIELHRMVEEVHQIAGVRLKRFVRGHVLFNYEGTFMDQLTWALLHETGLANRVHVVCSVRPCMSSDLQARVKEFSELHGYQLIGFSKDCIIESVRGFVSTECTNVSTYIKEWFGGREGVQIVSAVLHQDNFRDFLQLNNELRGFILQARYLAGSPDPNNRWDILFPFEGLTPEKLIAAYASVVQTTPRLTDLPSCYLTCYNEGETAKLRALIEQISGRCRPPGGTGTSDERSVDYE